MSCGIDTEAQELFDEMTSDADFTLPVIDLDDPIYQVPADSDLDLPITRLTNADLTTTTLDGTGTFDVLMRAFKTHLKEEFDKNRIVGSEYTKAYIALTESAMAQGTQFLLGRDGAYWQAVIAQQQARIAQIQVITARVTLATTKADYAKSSIDALTAKANYALVKLKLATESIQYCTAKFQLDFLLPQQLKLLTEQTEAAHAQTADTRMDGVTPISGTLGAQKALYEQQVISYQRDAEVKAAKLFSDAWITQKTIDEGLLAPPNFQNASIDIVLGHIKSNNNLD